METHQDRLPPAGAGGRPGGRVLVVDGAARAR